MPDRPGLIRQGLIRQLMRYHRLDNEQLAARTGLDPKLIGRLASRDTGLSGRTAEALAEVFGVHPEVLILAQYLEVRELAWDREDAERKGRET